MGSGPGGGRWVWIEFHTSPLGEVRTKLKELGFHWNGPSKCCQNPCGIPRGRSRHDLEGFYRVVPAIEMHLNEAPAAAFIKEFKVVALRECLTPSALHI
jgi:hypothetical protein